MSTAEVFETWTSDRPRESAVREVRLATATTPAPAEAHALRPPHLSTRLLVVLWSVPLVVFPKVGVEGRGESCLGVRRGLWVREV